LKRIPHERVVPAHSLAVFGLGGLWPGMRRERRETIIAVNFGGCVIPTGLALYELLQLAARGAPALWAVLIAGIVNIAVCYFLARPVQGVGILLPGLVPAAVAAIMALIFAPSEAAPVAYIAVSPARSSARISSILGKSSRAPLASPVSAEPELSTASSSLALLRPISHEARHPRKYAGLKAP